MSVVSGVEVTYRPLGRVDCLYWKKKCFLLKNGRFLTSFRDGPILSLTVLLPLISTVVSYITFELKCTPGLVGNKAYLIIWYRLLVVLVWSTFLIAKTTSTKPLLFSFTFLIEDKFNTDQFWRRVSLSGKWPPGEWSFGVLLWAPPTTNHYWSPVLLIFQKSNSVASFLFKSSKLEIWWLENFLVKFYFCSSGAFFSCRGAKLIFWKKNPRSDQNNIEPLFSGFFVIYSPHWFWPWKRKVEKTVLSNGLCWCSCLLVAKS